MRWRSALAALLLAPGMALAAQDGVPMELPEPIVLPSVDTPRIGEALLTALTHRKWIVELDDGEAITARIRVRVHQLRLRLAYRSTRVTFHYVDSENYAYEVEEGVPLIHARANKLIQQLGEEVRLQLQPLMFQREPAEVVPLAPAEPAPAAEIPSPINGL